MSSTRQMILAKLRQRQSPVSAKPQSAPIPARARLPADEQVALFEQMAIAASATVQHAERLDNIPEAIAEFILRENLPGDIVLAPDPELTALAWSDQKRLRLEQRPVRDGDRITITPVFAGIAETGTLMLLSGAHSPTTLNFLPDIHIAILKQSRIVGPYEDAWQWLRERDLPRTINLITGPSRSADIEQTLQLGAHGPVQLHIVLVAQ